ncbi:MAG: YicC family protein [Bacteroidetes bacterium]|nr:YicC family protein [Bacteroidota bacterium]MBI3481441.1 YicC family protein [Bacteroidota bacterium]
MIRSMTGFGQAIANYADANIIIEVKSLNSKFLDLSMRLPKKFSDKENEIRTLLAEALERGKVSISIEQQKKIASSDTQRYDENLFASNYAELKKLADKVMADYDSLFQMALDAPGVKQTEVPEEADPGEWEKIISLLKNAIDSCNSFRDAEGEVLGNKLESYISNINQGLQQVIKLEPSRTERIRSKLKENISSTFSNENADANRLEQEMIYYIEKLDVQEECVRLSAHLSYFLNVMKEKNSNGKKLGFISQEIGREINTIGSKANDAAIQKHVVEMKDELEKIKEQLNNVL